MTHQHKQLHKMTEISTCKNLIDISWSSQFHDTFNLIKKFFTHITIIFYCYLDTEVPCIHIGSRISDRPNITLTRWPFPCCEL